MSIERTLAIVKPDAIRKNIVGEAIRAAERAGLRVARIRLGVVLSSAGGALARMMPPFRLGLGGRVGVGRQYLSWIKLDDEVLAFVFLLIQESLDVRVNVVAPSPV
ncbi:MAG: hypothetical protein JSV80_09230, partial [Acidobacteriota bacterium]